MPGRGRAPEDPHVSPPADELDLLDLLSADHRTIAGADPRHVVADVAQHVQVERDLLYPAIREYATDAKSTLEDLRRAERSLEQRLSDYENDPSTDKFSAVQAEIREHVEMQEPLFEELRQSVPDWRLRELAAIVGFSIGGAPTHAHPHIPESGPIGEVAEELAGVADHLRDRLHGKDD